MPSTPLSAFPAQFEAGTSLLVARTYAGYTASEWVATFEARGIPGALTCTGSVVSGGYQFSVPYSSTQDLDSGWMGYVVYLTSDTERVVAERGRIEVLPATLDIDQSEQRTTAQMIVDKIDEIMLSPDLLKQQSMSIAGRSITWRTSADLIAIRNHYAAIVETEDARARRDKGDDAQNFIYFRFVGV